MRYIITGGSGFIGNYLRVEMGSHRHTLLENYDHADAGDASLIETEKQQADVVIHLAGVLGTSELFDNPHRAFRENVMKTLNVLDYCSRTKAGYVGITMPWCWPSIYQATKIAAVHAAQAMGDANEFVVNHVRAFNVTGPGQKVHGVRKMVPYFSHCAWRRIPLEIWGSGDQFVDLIHVKEVASIFRQVAEATAEGTYADQTIDAGSGIPRRVQDVASFIVDHVSEHGIRLDIVHQQMRRGERDYTPVEKLVSQGEGWDLLERHPEPFSSDDLALTVDYYREPGRA